jgi:DNA-binding beta-propeller fold protein YncE
MAVQTGTPLPNAPSQARKRGAGRVFIILAGIVSFSLLGYLLFEITHQFVVPPPARRLILIQDVPLPSGLPTPQQEKSLIPNAAQETLLSPGVTVDFDGFDFQAIDEPTHRLFLAHSGPSPDLLALDKNVSFNPTRDGPFDGNVIVFDTQQQKVIARINIPQVAGVVDAPDIGKVFVASDTDQSIIYAIDVHTLKATPIVLNALESPDALSYDAVGKRIFASDPGNPANPNVTMNVDRGNENVAVIDAVNDKLIKYINLGNLPLIPGENVPANLLDLKNSTIPRYGHDVGHNVYDEGLQRLFVTSTVLPNADDPNPFVLPPRGTGEFFEIDPANAANPIAKEIDLPPTCSTPHGMNIDEAQQVAFIACTDFDSASQLFENLVRVDLTTMTVIPTDPKTTRLEGGPDIVRIDKDPGKNIDVLFVACAAGISMFDITPGHFHKLGDEIVGKETHTIAIDPQTQTIYLTMTIGGRPVLRILRFNPNGQSLP